MKCQECGAEIGEPTERRNAFRSNCVPRNKKYCEDCAATRAHGDAARRFWPGIEAAERRIIAELDRQVKVYRAEEYSQEFLKSLIPHRA
jgi:hypothetical protein